MKNIIYIHYYHKTKPINKRFIYKYIMKTGNIKLIAIMHNYYKENLNISNKLIVIGFLRCIFKFKYFYYINL